MFDGFSLEVEDPDFATKLFSSDTLQLIPLIRKYSRTKRSVCSSQAGGMQQNNLFNVMLNNECAMQIALFIKKVGTTPFVQITSIGSKNNSK